MEHMLRYTGAVVALVASFLAAPEATRHLWDRLGGAAGRSSRSIAVGVRAGGARVQRTWNWLIGDRPAHRSVPTVQTAIELPPSQAEVVVSQPSPNPPATLAELKQYVDERTGMNTAAIAREEVAREASLRNVEHKIEQEADAIRSKLDSMEQTAMLVDARALPIIGLGVVLSSMSDLIARSPILSGLAIAVALTFLAWAWTHFWASGPAGR
jgi:hypothetical protein